MESGSNFEINTVYTSKDVVNALRRYLERERAELRNTATNEFRTTILDNKLPTPKQAEAALDEAVQLGRFQMISELTETASNDELITD